MKSTSPTASTVLRSLFACVLCFALVACGGSDSGDASGSSESGKGGAAEKPKVDPVKEAIKSIRGSHALDTAQGAWDAARALEAKAASADTAGARSFRTAAKSLDDQVLTLDPDFGPAREKAGQAKYDGALAAFGTADWLPEIDRAAASKLHERLDRAAKKDHGWLAADRMKEANTLLARLSEAKKKHDSLLESPWYKKALVIKQATLQELDTKLASPEGEQIKWDGAEVVMREPFVFFFQKDRGWDPQDLKERRAGDLMGVQDSMIQDFGERLGLTPLPGPIPVVFLRSREAYAKYKGEKKDDVSSEAHFEPWNGRLVVHDACKFTTLRHEATHQAMWTWTKRKRPTQMEAYWFQEGVADWYGAAKKVRDPKTGDWTYVMGRVEKGHLAALRRTKDSKFESKKIFKLRDLLKTTYGDKPKIIAEGRESLIYQQGWLFIYFLNYYNLDSEGYVDPSKPGIYRDKWMDFCQAQLEGKTGYRVFLAATGFSDSDIDRLEKEMWQFFEYLRYKAYSLEHLDEYGRLVRYDQYVNKRGKKTGEKEDDLLVQ